jgi:hypothetical protein
VGAILEFPKIDGGVVLAEIFTKAALYYLHERA